MFFYFRSAIRSASAARAAFLAACCGWTFISTASAQLQKTAPTANQVSPSNNDVSKLSRRPLPSERGKIQRTQAISDVELLPSPNGAISRDSSRSLLARRDAPLDLIDFRDTPMREAAKLLSDQTGLKIVPSAEASKVNISLYLRDVRPGVAIDALTKAHGLFYREDVETEIIRIYTTSEYEKDLGSFREERTEVFTLLYPNPVDVAIAIQGLFGNRVVLNLGVNESINYQDLSQRFTRFDLIDARNQGLGTNGGGGFGRGGQNFGTQNGFGTGANNNFSGGFGGGSGSAFGGGFGTGFNGGFGGNFGSGNGLNNFQNPQQQAQLNQPPPRLSDLTAEAIQRLEQTRDAAADSQERSAIDELLRSRKALIYVTVIRRNNQIVVRTSDEQIMRRIQELIQNLDIPTPLVLLEVKVMSLDLGDKFTSVFDYQFSDGSSLAGEFTSGNILAPATDTLAAAARRAAPLEIANSVANPGSDKDLTFQFVNASFRARIQFLENNNRVTNLATPLLLTANNEVSRIFIGDTVPLVTGFTPSFSQVTTGGAAILSTPTPQIELRDVGQSLLITPNINADRTVTLRIAQENSTINNSKTTIPVPNGTGGLTTAAIDTVRRATVSGTVVAKDNMAVAIGGLIDEGLSDSRAEVPVLGKLPVVGIFFRRQQTNRTRKELVIMIRPYVFNTPAESAALSCNLLQELSIHPASPHGEGTLNSFSPPEVLRANPPLTKHDQIFRFHSLVPKTY